MDANCLAAHGTNGFVLMSSDTGRDGKQGRDARLSNTVQNYFISQFLYHNCQVSAGFGHKMADKDSIFQQLRTSHVYHKACNCFAFL